METTEKPTEKKMTFDDHFHFIMETIDSSIRLDHLKASDNLIEGFVTMHSQNDQAPFMRASLQGMIVLKEYQLKKGGVK